MQILSSPEAKKAYEKMSMLFKEYARPISKGVVLRHRGAITPLHEINHLLDDYFRTLASYSIKNRNYWPSNTHSNVNLILRKLRFNVISSKQLVGISGIGKLSRALLDEMI